jgi:ATP-binding cassette subfamily B protein
MIMMLITSAWLAALMGVLLLLVVLPIWALGRHVRRSSKVSQDRVADTSAMAGEVLNAMPTVQAFGREPYERMRFNQSVEAAFREAKRRIRLRSILTAVAIMLAFSVITFVLWIGARQVSATQMTLGELTQFVMYAVLIAGSIGALSEVWGDLQRAAGATERLVELMRAKPTLSEAGGGSLTVSQHRREIADVSTAMPASAAALEFQDITFCYPSRLDYAALNRLNFTVASGARVALVGPSGAGKTTIFSLLLRFYEPTSGGIAVFGRDIRSWPIDALREQIGIVPQDPVIFAASAMDNIRYGRLEASDEEVIDAAKTAHAHGFISALPEGYASFLGERGVRLSGGQKQRISIARAILKNPPILLLDEATSALDAESEQAVQRALDAVLPGRTSLTIAHRLATVLHADRIIVMEAGVVVEQGHHTELIAQSGLYARLARLQFTKE